MPGTVIRLSRAVLFLALAMGLMTSKAPAQVIDQVSLPSGQLLTSSGLAQPRGQTFTVGIGGTLSRIDVMMTSQGTCRIHSTTNGALVGDLATNVLAETSASTVEGSWTSFDFSGCRLAVAPGQVLAFSVTGPGFISGSNGYGGGEDYCLCPLVGPTWAALGDDLLFRSWVTRPVHYDFELQIAETSSGNLFPSPMGAPGNPEGISSNGLTGVANHGPAADTLWTTSGSQSLFVISANSEPNPAAGVPPTSLTSSPEVYLPIPPNSTSVSFAWNGWSGDVIGNTTWNDGMMIDVVDATNTQLAVLVYRDAFSGTGTGSQSPVINPSGSFIAWEFAPAGMDTVSNAPLPAGAAYLRVSAFSANGPVAHSAAIIDDVRFTTSDPPVLRVCSGFVGLDYQIVIQNRRGTPNTPVFNAFTANAGAYPSGWFYGMDILPAELASQITLGVPPFSVMTDALGDAMTTLVIPSLGAPLGITLYAVSVELTPIPTNPSAPISVSL